MHLIIFYRKGDVLSNISFSNTLPDLKIKILQERIQYIIVKIPVRLREHSTMTLYDFHFDRSITTWFHYRVCYRRQVPLHHEALFLIVAHHTHKLPAQQRQRVEQFRR